jgi:hypothetical protein
MKRILLTSTALVAFAGAAAADVSLSGSATFSYNDLTGFDEDITITATGSQALDNGFTASASLSLDYDSGVAAVTGGDVSVSSDSSSITYYIDQDATGAALIGEHLDEMGGVANIFGNVDDDPIDEDTAIMASFTFGGTTVSASVDTANDYQLGVDADLGGTSIAVGFDGQTGGEFGVLLSGGASSVDYDIAFASDDSYAINAATSAGGADLTLNFGSVAGADATWEIGASMPLGDATVGVTFDEASAWEVSLGTSMEGVDLGLTFDSANAWEIEAGVSQGDLTANIMFNSADDVELTAAYAMGNGLTAYVGYFDGSNVVTYVGAEYDLGNGASVVVSNASSDDAEDEELGQEYVEGTTVSVSFSF